MSYSAAVILGLAARCAPDVAPQTVAAVVQTESGGDPFALYVNKARQPKHVTNADEATTTAQRYVAAGYSVDMGLGQINSRNMGRLGLNWTTIFEPCANLGALGSLLSGNYNKVSTGRDRQVALRVALSMYNTGDTSKGFRNGYVAKVIGNARIANGIAPQLPDTVSNARAAISQSSPDTDFRTAAANENASASSDLSPEVEVAAPPTWNVFEAAAYARRSHQPVTNTHTNNEGELQ